MSEFDLHPDRLGTSDEFGRRIFPQPADVKGKYRTWRTRVQFVLIFLFLALPWMKVSGKQALLLDIVNRKFEIFGLSLRAHNAPLFFLVLAAIGFGLFFVTAVWGRVWCGWACPQTVYIDGVFRRIERWVEGPALERRKLDRGPWSLRKFKLRAVKWSVYTVVCLILTHSFMAYFVGTSALREMMTQSPLAHWGSFVFMAFVTGILLFNFGWFREQFCVIACPYGRFQSVLMDSDSMIVAYDSARGEPRATPQAKVLAKAHGAKLGDCVNCYRCVQVCPVGIDIRRGVQMECVACTACVDACDDVMTKIKKPTGLIRYDSLLGLAGKKTRRLRPRAALYGAAMLGSVVLLVVLLELLKPVDVLLLRAKETPYQVIETAAGTRIVNHFKLEISNQSNSKHSLSVISDDPTLELVTAVKTFPVGEKEFARASVFVKFPKAGLINGQRKIVLRIVDTDLVTNETTETVQEVSVVGPFS